MRKCQYEQCKYDRSTFCIHPKNKSQLCKKEFCPLMKKIKLLQKCLICNYQCEYKCKKEDEDIIRASCLPCGHQGLFTLEEIKK